MLLTIVIALLCASAGTIGFCFGRARGGVEVAEQLERDPVLGRRVLEQLARQHGAKLELSDCG
jgi:hypothetical protein